MFKKFCVVFLLLLCCSVMPCTNVFASESTTYTYTISVDSRYSWMRTQDAYLPSAVFLQGMGLYAPEDLVIRDGLIYIADTGNKRIVVYDPQANTFESFGEDILKQPTGIDITADGHVYVADYGAEAVYEFDNNREVVLTITRPTSYLYNARAPYKPRSVAVSSKKTIYVNSEGSVEGLLQFDAKGEFQSYFGANPRDISPFERLQEIIFSEVQKERIMTRVPRPIANLALDNRDLVYTVSASPMGFFLNEPIYNSIRRLNTAGQNILIPSRTRRMVDEESYSNIAVNQHGGFFAITQTGVITEYDPQGQVIFSFGGRALSSERNGFFTTPVAVEVDDNDFVYVLDKERALIQVYYPTEFAMATHRAIDAFEAGDYTGSLALWEDLLLLNGMSKIARNGYGKSLFALNRYEEALDEFAFTYNYSDYSEVYWEIRNIWITKYITQVITGVIIFCIILYILSKIDKKTRFISRHFARFKTKTSHRNLLTEVLYIGTFIRHPIDSYYDLKKGRRGSVVSASVVYVLAFGVYLVHFLFMAFLFRMYSNINSVSPMYVAGIFLLPLFLFVIANYLVSSINNGEGSFKNVFVCTAYAFSPYILLMPIVVVISYACTLNESFVIDFSSIFIIALTAVYIYLMVQEVHCYSFTNTLLNILLTILAIFIALVGFLIIYLMAKQVVSFIGDLYREVLFRVS